MPLLKNQTTQEFVPLKEIRDGIVLLKDGGMRMVLMVSSINFELKSPDEQMALIAQYQNFLNSLDFPVQVFVESRRLDISPYITILEERLKEQPNDLIKVQTEEYIEFIKNFTDTHNIMSKTFFVVVPFNPINFERAKSSFLGGVFGKKGDAAKEGELRQFQEHKTQLEQRATVVEQGLSRLGIRVAQLGTEELVELYFKIFNPGEKDIPNLTGQV